MKFVGFVKEQSGYSFAKKLSVYLSEKKESEYTQEILSYLKKVTYVCP
jgi:hypothetical protein